MSPRAAIAAIAGSLLSVVLGAACVPPARARQDAGEPPAERSAERTVAALYAAFNRHDVPGMLALVDTGIVWLNVEGDSVMVETRGAAALEVAMGKYFSGMPSVRSVADPLVSAGPWVTARERVEWTTRAGAARSQMAMAVYEVRDGRIRRVWYYPVVR